VKKILSGIIGAIAISIVEFPAFALPEAQVLQKLQNIPVFAISDSQGSPLVASTKDPKDKNGRPYTGVFLSKREAESFISNLAKSNPKLVKGLLIRPLSLSEVYKIQQSTVNNKQAVDILFVPTQQQVKTALPLLQKTDPKATKFEGVPLFTAVAGNGKVKGYLTLSQNKKQTIPVFFDREQIQELVDRFKTQQPTLASTVEIQVLNLEGLLATLKANKNPSDQTLSQIVIYPSRESIEYLKTIQPAPQPATNPTAKPTVKPSIKPPVKPSTK
jgi:hypothetical protein